MFWRRKAKEVQKGNDIIVEVMEPRLLLSADVLGVDAGVFDRDSQHLSDWDLNIAWNWWTVHPMDDAGDSTGKAVVVDPTALSPLQALELQMFSEDGSQQASNEDDLDALALIDGGQDLRREIIFLDTGVADGEQLLSDLLNESDGATTQVYLINSATDGVGQITAVLNAQQELDAVHIISHGTAGKVQLGSGTLSSSTVESYTDQLNVWGSALAESGDILIYGCDLALDTEGQTLIDVISTLTGADVAASIDQTGNNKQGGDWELEYHLGDVETAALAATESQNWTGTLAVIDVTTVHDIDDNGDTTSVVNLKNNPGSDGISLREAIIATNNDAGEADTINLSAGTYTLALSGAVEDAAVTGDLDILDELTIVGAGVDQTIIDGANLDRVFQVIGGSAINVAISGLTIQNGTAVDHGAGIYILKQATAPVVDLSNVRFSGNHSTVNGGAIANDGNLTIENSLIDGNSSGLGGGVYSYIDGSLNMTNVTLSGNSATAGEGGGLYNVSTAMLSNVTVADNFASTDGGGLYNKDFGGGATTTIGNTLVANNTAGGGSPDLIGAFISNGNNLIETEGGATGLDSSDIIGSDPKLGVLDDNSGSTPTHALLAGSPAINTGATTGAPLTDQRGVNRDDNFPDIGAYEVANLSIDEGDDLVLDASFSSDFGGSIVQYKWDLNSDLDYNDVVSVTNSPTIAWDTMVSWGLGDGDVGGRSYTIGVQAVDNQNSTLESSTITVTIENVAPTLTTTGTGSVIIGNSYTLNLSAVDPGNDTIGSWTINWADGQIETFPGNPSSVSHTYAEVGFTHNILASAIDEDGTHLQNELLVASWGNNQVLRYDQDGGFLQTLAFGDEVDDPADVVIGPDGGIYVSGWDSNNVLKYNTTTEVFETFITPGDNGLDKPAGLAFGPDGNLYVASNQTSQVLRFDSTTGAYIDAFVTAGSGGLNNPTGLIFGPDGSLYVSDYINATIYKYDGLTGDFASIFVTNEGGELGTPEDIAFGSDGNLYVATDFGHSVLRYDGTTGDFIDAFVPSRSNGLNNVTGIAFGPDGNLYVGSFDTRNVLRFDGSTGDFIDEFVTADDGGLRNTCYFNFIPEHQVTVLGASIAGGISGIVYEDINGDGSILDDGTGAAGVNVDLYLDDGSGAGEIDANDSLVNSARTDANGNYTFTGLGDSTFWVVIDSTTINPNAGFNNGFSSSDAWAEQTYGVAGSVSFSGSYSYALTAGSSYGGMNSETSDNVAALTSAEHVTRVIVSGSHISNVDSGFSFNAITSAGDDGAAFGPSIQGSLRQFIFNSNAIDNTLHGLNSSQFAIPATDTNYDGSGNGEFTITPTAALPNITEALVLDGTTQTGYLGTPIIELTGTSAGAGAQGLTITGDNSIVRGLVISQFKGHGIQISGDNNQIESSYIGLNVVGDTDLGNKGLGVQIHGGSGNYIGGSGVGNTVSGNGFSGLAIIGGAASNNFIQGNLIGTDATGMFAIANDDYGVDIWSGGPDNNTVGGYTNDLRNVISGNGWAGIHISGSGATGNKVVGNYIGTNTLGTLGIANGTGTVTATGGIDIDGQATDNVIGGILAGTGNLIAHNNGPGVRIDGATTIRNSIQSNEIYSNTEIGIDLVSGNSDRQTATISSVTTNGGSSVTIMGSYGDKTLSFEPLRIEYFKNSEAAQEGATFLRFVDFDTDASGNATFNHVLPVNVAVGEYITATITDSSDNTSEFSVTLQAVATSTDNEIPAMAEFYDVVDTTTEDTEVELSFADLVLQFDEIYLKGTVVSFSVEAIASGTLRIGTSPDSATVWAAGTNDVINGSNIAYWTPDENASGTLNAFDVVAQDNRGASSIGVFTATVNVMAVNDEPELIYPIPDQLATEDLAFSFQFASDTFIDDDVDDSVSYSAAQSGGSSLPQWLSFDPATRSFSGMPLNGDTGVINISVTATDSSMVSVTSDFNLVVAAVNDAPVINYSQITLSPGETITMTTAILSIGDVDTASSDLTVTVNSVSGGHFGLNSMASTPIHRFTQAQLMSGNVIFVDDGDNTAPAYSLIVSDGVFAYGPVEADVSFTEMPEPVLGAALQLEASTFVDFASVSPKPSSSVQEEVVAAVVEPAVEPAGEPKMTAPDAVTDDVATDSYHLEVDAVPYFADLSARGGAKSADYSVQTMLLKLQVLEGVDPNLIGAAFEFDPLGAEIRLMLASDDFNESLDRMSDGINKASFIQQTMVGSGASITTGLSVGYVAWLVRGGVLLSSALSSLPAWQFIDPLPILTHSSDTVDDEDDDDSLEDIISAGADREETDYRARRSA